MKVLAISKYPPIQGGTAARCYFHYRLLAQAGHQVVVVTNAVDIDPSYRCAMRSGDVELLEANFGAGFVRTRFVDAGSVAGQFVPAGDAAVTRLAAVAMQEAETFGPDIIFTSYLEPYAVAAALVSHWSRTPYVLEHAGSDRTRLLSNPQLGPALARVLQGAAICFSNGLTLTGFGVLAERILPVVPSYLPPDLFSPEGARCASLIETDSVPILGVYGKVGVTKGSFDLLAAISRLRSDGADLCVAAMVGGRALGAFEREVAIAGLGDIVQLIPFACPWRVPLFLRACDAVCVLERDFPVRIHGPKMAREVLATGRCLVVSEEIRNKQPDPDRFIDGDNVLVVADPRDTGALAGTLKGTLDREAAARIGRAGHELVQPVDAEAAVAQYQTAFEQASDLAPSGRGRANQAKVVVPHPSPPPLGSEGGEGYAEGVAWLRREPCWPLPDRAPDELGPPCETAPMAWENLVPELQAPVRLMTLAGGAPGGPVPSKAATVLFVKSGDLLGRAYTVSASVSVAVSLLDGSRSNGEICDEARISPSELRLLLGLLTSDGVMRMHGTVKRAQLERMVPPE